jgi:hypothetical protein
MRAASGLKDSRLWVYCLMVVFRACAQLRPPTEPTVVNKLRVGIWIYCRSQDH